jgi:peptidoglycan/LPS O-acetylase OafA/YrhL
MLGKKYQETANPFSFYFFWSNFSILNNGFPYSPVLAVLWTVSVEEQFYICWPWLMKLFKRNRATLFSLLIILSIAFRIYYRNDGVTLFFNSFCIMSDFAIGAWLAMISSEEYKIFNGLKRMPRSLIVVCYLVIISCIIFYHPVFNSTIATVFERLILGIGFGIIILDQVFCENRIFNLSQIPGAQWLGKRAYGFYCFHQVGILVSIKILTALEFIRQPFQYAFIMPVLAFIITVLMAALSYGFFEKYFLNLKRKFEA